MNFFRRLSIKMKLIIASLIPMLALFYYLQQNIIREQKVRQSAEQTLSDVSQVDGLSALIHELQKERALTLAFVSSRGTEARDQLPAQRELTDRAIFSMEKNMMENPVSFRRDLTLDSLSKVRETVNNFPAIEIIDSFYSGLKVRILDKITLIVRSSTNTELKNQLEEHLSLLYTKDFLASMRSELGSALAINGFSERVYGNFASSKGKHDINLHKFKMIASPDLKEYFLNKFQDGNVKKTYAIIDSAYNNFSLRNFTYTLDSWLESSTSSINLLKEVEDYSNILIRKKADKLMSEANSNLIRSSVIAIVVMLLIFIIVSSIIRGIVNDIHRIKEAAERMAQGDLGMMVDVRSEDEIGALAKSFNLMISEMKSFSETANKIGKGDYSMPVKIRSDVDTLGIALDRMKSDLQQLSQENETRTWLLRGSSELNDKLRGEMEIKIMAQDAITFISSYLEAQIGAVYLNENNRLNLIGSYAFHFRKNNANSFKPGQGLVGQAALEKKPIVFREIPEDYIRIQSGMGNSVPRNILVFPFLYEGEVKGVLEIGASFEFSRLHLSFLEMVGENLAIAFNSAESRSRLKDLLEETQRQAEELEAQQEELKQSNEELLEKTELLERSESELKTQQEELQQTNEELEEKANLLEEQKEKIENAKIDIENKARELEVTSRYKSEFLANMSHELRTPLNSILILSQLLVENKTKHLGDKEIEFAKNIYNSGADLLNLINEILDLSKVESGRMELDISAVSLKDIDTNMQSMFSEVAKSKSIDFTIEDLAGDIKNITTDKQRLEQILRNLLSNAFKFTGRGGRVRLKIEKASPQILNENKNLKNAEDILAFTVSDSGIGIPREKLGIIFEAFQQADGSTKRKFGGTGLGLSISRELASVLGGEIHVESEEGTGSHFTLYLPVQFGTNKLPENESRAAVKLNKPRSFQSKQAVNKFPVREGEVLDDRDNINESDKTILIMEDDPEFSQTLLDFVRDRNFKGIVAAQGNTGLSYARHYKPDAILLDMKLPVMDGTEVLKHLKNDPDLRHVPVQIISGYDKRKEGLELGAFDFVQKPVNRDDLTRAFSRIEDFINRKLKKLLVVEDNEMQNKAIRELIGNGDVKSFPAYGGEEAFNKMKADHFDCVIVDLGLPDMSGFDLLEKIKSDEQLKKVPVVVYTGRDLSKEENARLLKYANTVVLKTADSQERLLDETMLFLHRVESKLPREKQNIIRKLHKTNEVLQNKKVLVVDDDIRNIYSLTNVLEDEGMRCLTAENGHAALKMLKENPDIDVVLMDVMMPEMDGYDATREIRKIDRFARLPIIALTARAMKGDREKCLNAGMSDYISKPVNIEQLLSLMRVWLYS